MKTGTLITLLFLTLSSLINAQYTVFTLIPDSISGIPYNLNFDTSSYGSYSHYTYKAIDFDNDGDLDIYAGFSRVFENLGNDSFNLIFPFQSNTADWVDFDNDGDLDLFTGSNYQNPTSQTSLMKNNLPDSNGFSLLMDTCHKNEAFMWGGIDVLNKGSYTISRANYNYYNSYTKIFLYNYINNSNCTVKTDSFNNNTPTLLPFAVHIGVKPNINDVNNDGYNDITNLIFQYSTGMNKSRKRMSLINNGLDSSNIFTTKDDSILYYDFMTTTVADLDNDGYLDQALSWIHFDDQLRYRLLRNNQNGTFSQPTNTYIPVNLHTRIQVFDANNDGKQDLLLTKQNDTNTVFLNMGNFTFFEYPFITNLNCKLYHSLSFDYDNDGDLDLFISGFKYNQSDSLIKFTALYRNDSTPPNNPPTAPQTLWTTMDSTK